MAKQKGNHLYHGKLGGEVFYMQKGVGALVRTQNEGMSERVKSAPEFANTRKNASEFGGAGKLAGLAVRTVSQRWRYILDPFATGKLAKFINEQIKLDTANPWGERELPATSMAAVQEMYNRFSKNEMEQAIVLSINGATYSTNDENVVIRTAATMSVDFVNRMKSFGADKVSVSVYAMECAKPQFDPASGKYLVDPAHNTFRSLTSLVSDVEVGEELVSADNLDASSTEVQNTTESLGGILVVMLPMRTINNVDYVLQEHCAAYWKTIPTAE